MVDLNLDQSCSRYLKVEVVNHPIFKILAEVDHAQLVHYVELAYNAKVNSLIKTFDKYKSFTNQE